MSGGGGWLTKHVPLSPLTLLLLGCLAGLGGGGAAWIAGTHGLGDALWAATAALALVSTAVTLVQRLLRRSAGVDIIAVLAIVGALVLGEYWAGAVIGLMIATGRALEAYAANRAERELSSLLSRREPLRRMDLLSARSAERSEDRRCGSLRCRIHHDDKPTLLREQILEPELIKRDRQLDSLSALNAHRGEHAHRHYRSCRTSWSGWRSGRIVGNGLIRHAHLPRP